MSHITIPNSLFFEDVCRRIQQKRGAKIRVQGRSMEPFLKDGRDYIIVDALPDGHRFRRGELLLFVYGDRYIVHRVHRIKGDTLYMKGDHQNHWEIIHEDDVRAWISCVEYANGRRVHSMSRLWKILYLRSRIDRQRKNFHHFIKRMSGRE